MVMMASIPEYSEDAVTKAEAVTKAVAGGCTQQFSAVLDQILPVVGKYTIEAKGADEGGSKRQFSAVADTISDAWARLVVNPVMNAWRMATGIDTPGLLQYCEAQARHGP